MKFVYGGVRIEVTGLREISPPDSNISIVESIAITTKESTMILTTETNVNVNLTTTTLPPPSSEPAAKNLSTNQTIVTPTTNPISLNETITNNILQKLNITEYVRRSSIRKSLSSYSYYCPCDIKINFCDINCCCDIDCADKDIKKSMHCDEHQRTVNEYVEISMLELCPNQPGLSLFCIIEGHKKRKIYKERNMLVDRIDIKQVIQYKWPSPFGRSEENNKNDLSDVYKFDDKILAWNFILEQLQSISKYPIFCLQYL